MEAAAFALHSDGMPQRGGDPLRPCSGGSHRSACSPLWAVQNYSRQPGLHFFCAGHAPIILQSKKTNLMKYIAFILLLSLTACNNQLIEETKVPEENAENKSTAIALQLFEYFNQHDWKKMANLYADSALFKDPSLGTKAVVQSHSQTIEKYTALQQLFPDIHDEVIAVYPSGEKQVIVEFISTGTAPDSSKFELPVCTVFTIENGIIVKDFTYYDNVEE
jgi:ketosteroid isomerase-like protein